MGPFFWPWRIPALALLLGLLFVFLPTARGGAPVTLLQPGVVVEGNLDAKAYAYYEVDASGHAAQDLILTATPLSGDCDMYAGLAQDLPFPTVERYEWASSHLGQDSLLIAEEDPKNCRHRQHASGPCKYRCGVYGYTGGSYTLVARWNSSEPLPLVLGRPQADSVSAGTFRQYQMQITPELVGSSSGQPPKDLQVQVQPLNGDPDVFVTLDGQRPTADHYQYRSSDWGNSVDRIVLAPRDSLYQRFCPDFRCTLRVGVYGFHDASYSLLASVYTEAIRLQQDVPLGTTLRPATAQRFTVPWPPTNVGSVRVSVSPQSGPAPRLYASCRTAFPNATSPDWFLDVLTSATQTLSIDAAAGQEKGCKAGSTLTLSLEADSLATCSLLVTTDASSSMPRLLPGVLVPGVVKQNSMAYFQLRLGGSEYQNVELSLTVTSGEVDVYVSESFEGKPVVDKATGLVSSYKLSSTHEGDDRLTIKHSDLGECGQAGGVDSAAGSQQCYVIVGVVGRRFAQSTFRLLATTQDATVTLHDGMAVRDVVPAKSYRYFRMIVVNPALDLTITATPFGGDPDLYIGVPPNTHPTKSNYTWASRGFGADSLTLQTSEMQKHCQPDPAVGQGCAVYVGVFGWTETTFSILASLNMGWLNPFTLVPGRPQSGEVAKGAYSYYKIRIPPVARDGVQPVVRLTLLPEDESDQDLYVSFDRAKEPGKENYDLRSTNWAANDEIVIPPDSPHYCTDCYVYAAVYGYEPGPFSLVATLSTAQQELQVGVPVRGTVAGSSYAYYLLDWRSSLQDLSVTLSPEAGRPQVFASCVHAYPNATAHAWALDSRYEQVLSLNATAAAGATAEGACPFPSKLWLAVWSGEAGAGSASYSLMVAGDNSSTGNLPLLVPGTPTSGAVRFHQMRHYLVKFGADGYVDMELVLSVQRGEAHLYVSQSYEGRPVYDVMHNVVANYTLKSERTGNDRILVPRSQFGECHAEDCYFVVGVLGKSASMARYSLVARREEAIVTLQEGLAMRDFVGAKEYKYFSVKVTEPTADLSIHLTSFTGDADLFVAVAPNLHPTQENHTWASTGFGSDSLTIQAEEMKENCTPDPARGVACDYFLSVFGWNNASFSIMASLHRGWREPIELFPGQPQAGAVSKGEYVYYSYYVPANATAVRFVLTPQNLAGGINDEDDWENSADLDWLTEEADQDLFLTTSRDREPGETQFDFQSMTWAGVDEITFSADEAGEAFCQDCVVYLSVFGYAGEEGEYTLRVEAGISTLQSAVPVTGHLSMAGAATYRIYNGDPAAHLLLSCVTLSGDADIYVLATPPGEDDDETDADGTPRELPSKTKYHWRSNKVGDDVVEILPSDEHYCFGCDYLVTVEAFTNTSFVLTASVEALSVIPLAAGRPQTSHVNLDEMQYFSCVLGTSAEDLRVSLTLLMGRADLFIADTVDLDRLPHPNDPGSWRYSSRNKGRNEVVIPGPHKNRTRFAIGVHGLADASAFSVLASFSQMTPIYLQEGMPVQHYLSPGHMEWFTYRISKAESLFLSLTTLSGDPDLLASTQHMRPKCLPATTPGLPPQCGNWTWMISQADRRISGDDQLVILHDAPCSSVGSTRVAPDSCTPSSINPGKNLWVGVFAESAETSFTLTLTTGGGHTTLLPGRPQHGATRLGVVCETRTEDGACDTSSSSSSRTAQVSYFKLLVPPPNALFGEDEAAHVSVVLEPQCNNAVQAACPVGCPCNPLVLYVSSCEESECKAADEYPGPLHYQAKQEATHSVNTLFLAHDKYNHGHGFCNPKTAGQPCLYFVSVYHPERDAGGSFTLTASTSHDVTILPTRRTPAPPDGLVSSSLDRVDTSAAATGSKRYQMYTQQGSNVLLSLEACSGEVSLAVCDGSCAGLYPTEKDYRFFADATQTCSKAEGCKRSGSPVPRIGLDRVQEESYFLSVNGTGSYLLQVATRGDNGHALAPVLSAPAAPTLRHVREDRVTVSWKPATLSLPGQKHTMTPGRVRYKFFALAVQETTKTAVPAETPVLHTLCGLDHYALGEKGASTARVADLAAGTTSYTVTDLRPGTPYVFAVVALCDSECLRDASSNSAVHVPCGGAVPCQEQHGLYTLAHLNMPTSGSWPGFDPGTGSLSLTATMLLLVLLASLATVGGLLVRQHRLGGHHRLSPLAAGRPQQQVDSFEMSPTGAAMAARGGNALASPRGRAGAGGRYERLLMEGEGEEEEGGGAGGGNKQLV